MFVISKIIIWLINPGNILIGLAILGMVLVLIRRRNLARMVLITLAILIFIIGATPFGQYAHFLLADRFPQPASLPTQVDGIIVLSGEIKENYVPFNHLAFTREELHRLDLFVSLAKHYPQAKLVFSGGSASILSPRFNESDSAAPILEKLLAPDRPILYERKSRNTYENAIYSKQLVRPDPEEVWILITSASHMPRSVGCFRRTGWSVIPYPTHISTLSLIDWRPNLLAGIVYMSKAAYEWVGLLGYWIFDRIDTFFPKPILPTSIFSGQYPQHQ